STWNQERKGIPSPASRHRNNPAYNGSLTEILQTAGSYMVRLPRVRREGPGRRAAEQRDVQNRGRHAINVVTVLTRPSAGYAKFFGRIIGRILLDKSCASRCAMDQANSPLLGGQCQ